MDPPTAAPGGRSSSARRRGADRCPDRRAAPWDWRPPWRKPPVPRSRARRAAASARQRSWSGWPALWLGEIAALACQQAGAGFPLIDQQIEGRRLAGEPGQQAMGLAAMMGLMVEEMQQERRQPLFDLRRTPGAAIADRPGKPCLVECIDIGDDAGVLDLPRPAETRE